LQKPFVTFKIDELNRLKECIIKRGQQKAKMPYTLIVGVAFKTLGKALENYLNKEIMRAYILGERSKIIDRKITRGSQKKVEK